MNVGRPASARRTTRPSQAPDARVAVVVDDWPLVRLGIARVLHDLGIGEVIATAEGHDGVRQTRARSAQLVLLGAMTDQPLAETVRSVKRLPHAPRAVALVSRIEPDELRALLGLDVDAVLLRTVGPQELADAVGTVEAGERVVAHALLTAMYGAKMAPPTDVVPHDPLTQKERQVLRSLAQGASNKEIAAALHVSAATVKTHLSNIYAKLGAESRHDAVAQAVARGLLS